MKPGVNVRLHIVVTGDVQGVGFRDWTRRTAQSLGLSGSAVNRADGGVEIVVEGPRDSAEELRRALDGPTPGAVEAVDADWSDAQGVTGFRTG